MKFNFYQCNTLSVKIKQILHKKYLYENYQIKHVVINVVVNYDC